MKVIGPGGAGAAMSPVGFASGRRGMKRNSVLFLMVTLVAGFSCRLATAQVSVTPTLKPTPAGQLIVVNNGPGMKAIRTSAGI